MNNEIMEKEIINIKDMIYEIDGKEIMLDSDLAKLYHVETKRINEAVKNNPEKFPERYSWVLSDAEKNNLWSKFSTANISSKSRVNPRVLFDAHVVLLEIFEKAKDEIIIIDNYAGKELLDILKKVNRKIIIVSKNIDETLKKKYEKQYNNVAFINNNSFHDRFIIIDRNKLYSCGSSFKDLGKKCFAINEIENKKYIDGILDILFVKKN